MYYLDQGARNQVPDADPVWAGPLRGREQRGDALVPTTGFGCGDLLPITPHRTRHLFPSRDPGRVQHPPGPDLS